MFKIRGIIPAVNYLRVPSTKLQTLGLTGRLLYIQVGGAWPSTFTSRWVGCNPRGSMGSDFGFTLVSNGEHVARFDLVATDCLSPMRRAPSCLSTPPAQGNTR